MSDYDAMLARAAIDYTEGERDGRKTIELESAGAAGGSGAGATGLTGYVTTLWFSQGGELSEWTVWV